MKKLFYTTFFFLLLACSAEEQSEETIDLLPGLFNLIYPENGSACLDGSIINDTQSKITFLWNASQNTNEYEVEIINLNDNYSQKMLSKDRSLEVVLKHGEPYAWTVTALVDDASITSKEWKFYLAGNGIVNYAPFPPELISPRPSARVNLNSNGQVILNWTSSDVDGDLETYELYMDQNDGSTLIQTFTKVENTIEIGIDADPDITYLWKVLAIDSDGNSSSSGVYSFVTQ
ncbi:MAG: hypothetical protein P8I34_02895 [Flavobacteriaceae bacterium]|nr:hypothetical protein [Flavobacteriaceae bacterium]MDG1965575.1 hypothetical protein [Flavobacteriaceae bacterium]